MDQIFPSVSVWAVPSTCPLRWSGNNFTTGVGIKENDFGYMDLAHMKAGAWVRRCSKVIS